MNYRLFQYTLPAPPELEDLNAFLNGHRVAAVTQHLVQAAGGAMLVFVVETAASPSSRPPGPSQAKVDYRQILTTEEFAVFSRLRDARRSWAEAEGVPVYTILTNAQLADMVKRRVRTMAELAAIDGVGPARVGKHGAGLLACLADLPPAITKPDVETP